MDGLIVGGLFLFFCLQVYGEKGETNADLHIDHFSQSFVTFHGKKKTNGSKRRRMVLFGSKHEYRQDQGSGGEHLNKNTLRRVDTHCQVRTVRTKN